MEKWISGFRLSCLALQCWVAEQVIGNMARTTPAHVGGLGQTTVDAAVKVAPA